METGSSTFPSNRDRFEALESSTLWMKEKIAENSTNMTHMQGAIASVTNATEENMKAVEGMRQDLQAVLARLGGGPNGDNRVQPPRVEEEQLVDGRETHISESTRGEPRPRQPLRLGGRVENEHEVVERWLQEEESDRDVTDHARTEERLGGSRLASQLQTCHGKPMASTKTCLDIVPQQDFGHQPSQPVVDDQEWLPTAATSGGGAPPLLAVTERDVTSMAWGVEGASPPMEENGGGATV
ncbi:hypothetical protein CJ030_MR4G026985 [Morella rubra]|uniref:Uncharacterized protein n=1 Tax=Morella rubra TaxID=262757 RepID=A0A6A1VRC6_9ROSI|nr:hypothetical protein CJ030_MR4G026985 [Morella rubra]